MGWLLRSSTQACSPSAARWAAGTCPAVVSLCWGRLSVLLVARGAGTGVCSLPLPGAAPGSSLGSESVSPGLDVSWEVSWPGSFLAIFCCDPTAEQEA